MKLLASEIQLLKVEQAFLSINAFIEIYFLAEAIEILKKIASNAEQKGTFDIFVKKIKTVGYQQEIKKEIERVIDIETQNINESCSPELRKIRNEIRAKEQESLSIFRKMVRTLKQKDMLAESEEEMEEGFCQLRQHLNDKWRAFFKMSLLMEVLHLLNRKKLFLLIMK